MAEAGEMRVSELLNKSVITNKGNDLGVVTEVELAWKDCYLKGLLVEPSKDMARRFGANMIEVPWSAVMAVGKYVVVDEDKVRPRR